MTTLFPDLEPRETIDGCFIASTRILSFKGIRDCEITLPRFGALVGANNSGKSTILQALYTAVKVARPILLGQREQSRGQYLSELPGVQVADLQSIWFASKTGGGKVPAKIRCELSDSYAFQVTLRFLYGSVNATVSTEVLDRPHELDAALVPGYAGVSVHEEERTKTRRARLLAEGKVSEVLRSLVGELNDERPDDFRWLQKQILTHFDVELSPVVEEDKRDAFLRNRYSERNSQFDISSAGSGFLQILQLCAYALYERPRILLLDEPDAHLNSSLQGVLVQLLRELSERVDCQILLATHSKEMIGRLRPAEIVPVSREDEKIQPLSHYGQVLSVLRSVGNIDNIDLAMLLRTKRALFVEGEDDKILRQVATVLGLTIFEGDHQVVPIRMGGKNRDDRFGELKTFRTFIGDNLRAAIIRDNDLMMHEESKGLEQDLGRHFQQVVVWPAYELENLFLSPALIASELADREAGETWPVSRVEAALDDACEKERNWVLGQLSEGLATWYRRNKQNTSNSVSTQQAAEFMDREWANRKRQLTPGSKILTNLNVALEADRKGLAISVDDLVGRLRPETVPQPIADALHAVARL